MSFYSRFSWSKHREMSETPLWHLQNWNKILSSHFLGPTLKPTTQRFAVPEVKFKRFLPKISLFQRRKGGIPWCSYIFLLLVFGEEFQPEKLKKKKTAALKESWGEMQKHSIRFDRLQTYSAESWIKEAESFFPVSPCASVGCKGQGPQKEIQYQVRIFGHLAYLLEMDSPH